MIDKSGVLGILDKAGIGYELYEHQRVFNMEEAGRLALPHPGCEAKNLFLRDDRRRCYYLVTVRGDKKLDLKAFRHLHGTRVLSFASEEDLLERLCLGKGSVTPFGLLNNSGKNVIFFLDEDFRDGIIGVHPNDNSASVFLDACQLVRILEEHGSKCFFTRIPERLS